MKELQGGITRLLPDVVKAEIEPESCPTWLRRPGRTECVGMWESVAAIYVALTGLVLPEQAPWLCPEKWCTGSHLIRAFVPASE